MKMDVEMKAILSASHARCCNGNYNHYHVLVGFWYTRCRNYKMIGWELGEKEGGNIARFLLSVIAYFLVFYIFSLLIQ